MRNVCVIAGGQSTWGLRRASQRDLFQEAGKACFDSNDLISNKNIDGLIVASAGTGRCSLQTHLAPLVAEYLGIKPESVCARVELSGASGSAGIIMAYGLIKSGVADVVMVAGGEKLHLPQCREADYSGPGSLDRDWDGAMGLGLPPLFALAAKQHMKKYGTTEEQMALVAVKNRRNGMNNPKGQFREPVDLKTALNAKTVVQPLKLFDCCPVTDGAAAIILAVEDKARYFTDQPLVYIRGCAQASAGNMTANMASWTTWEALKTAARQAYRNARIQPQDVDVAQTHDCFTIAEIIAYEDLGFCEKGEGGCFIQEGKADFGGQVPVNTDGGLLSCGHPPGATGIRQGIEIMRQLRGDAVRQVAGARIGLTHNLSGAISAHTVVVYGRDLE
ncbi:thiolase C-terminal domain-containing protein [Desulfotomaculum copahuensis]|uniref:propanoyl-CoA C-acyltransferase n=1 Tax=Desulfotomaculum copahuensis TaxID=1838280 RepID=A0A1B7LGW5_9FIRM|nr:acetyl-CoA acetyltransferase [Desulfotomaculum copahuensis]OAT85249.1 acetyl-CoA acetyltransferase [Desulfotomaculum copahuensis]